MSAIHDYIRDHSPYMLGATGCELCDTGADRGVIRGRVVHRDQGWGELTCTAHDRDRLVALWDSRMKAMG